MKHTDDTTQKDSPQDDNKQAAADFFAELETAYSLVPDYRAAYDEFARLFNTLLLQNTDFENVGFAGQFARTSYLLKERGADREHVRMVNTLRVRLRKRAVLSDDDLCVACQDDLMALAVFARLVYGEPVPTQLRSLFPNERTDKSCPYSGANPVLVGVAAPSPPGVETPTMGEEGVAPPTLISSWKDKSCPYSPGSATSRPQDHKTSQSQKVGKVLTDVMRVVINSWDEEYLYATEDDENADDVTVSYATGNAFYDYDWTYLREYFREGARLNLVRPRIKDGTVYPELIIYEPDILIDVSAVAACFQDYGATPLHHLLSKLCPTSATPPIVLGNLASQFLDEEVNKDPSDNNFNDSIKTFYQSNALNLLTSGAADDAAAFYEEARCQKQFIHDAVRNQLPAIVGRFNPKSVILEPSFFSEMLGLQGRMDFLQLDQQVVIEQKSGRCGFPQPNADTPVLKTQHYVQVLLYMLILRYNYSEQYRHNNGALQAFLLYSKYKRSLLSTGFAPELVFNAIKVRNAIALGEQTYARRGFGVLDTLTADDFLTNERSSAFFERYIRPKVEGILTPIQHASTLERAYFHRFMRFIAAEHLLSKIGNQTKECSGFASMWHDSLSDKLQAGNIYDNLQFKELPKDGGRIETVTLRFTDLQDDFMPNFRVGDIVVLYPYHRGEEPNACQTMVFRCSIEEITPSEIRLKLRAPQSDANVFAYHNYYRWAVEHDFMESSFAPLYRGMFSFLTATEQRRQLILLQREPQVDTSRTLKGDYGAFNDLALRVKQANDLYLILGPPGTGKTSFGLLNTLQEELLEEKTSILLLSYTNRAVDEICSKLVAADIDFIRIGSELSCADEYKGYLLSAKTQLCPKLNSLKAMLTATRVYVGTTTALNSHIALFALKQFDLAIIDEASQILEPHLMGLLCARHGAECAIRKFVMIGDHKQLPAVVQQTVHQSTVAEPALQAIGLDNCRNSLFQRLYQAYSGKTEYAYMLTHQGRMHGDIAAFPSTAFYGGTLGVVPVPHQTAQLPRQGQGRNGIDDLLTTRRMAFISVPSLKHSGSDKVNQAEAEVIAAMVYRIYLRHKEAFSPTETVGVIVPYRNQIAAVRHALARQCADDALQAITIDTVERYQGSQRDYIIYGFTVSRRYQLSFLTSTNFTDEHGETIDRKLNVAMTRAREHLFLVGNTDLLARNSVYRSLIAALSSRHSLISISTDDFINGRFKVPLLPTDSATNAPQ